MVAASTGRTNSRGPIVSIDRTRQALPSPSVLLLHGMLAAEPGVLRIQVAARDEYGLRPGVDGPQPPGLVCLGEASARERLNRLGLAAVGAGTHPR
jgi:hypothetical protein